MAEDNNVNSYLVFLISFLVVYSVIYYFYLKTLINFIKSMKLETSVYETSTVWVWTQVIPLWGFVAFIVFLIKIETQYKFFLIENNNMDNLIYHYDSKLGWWLLGTSFVSAFFTPLVIVSFIILILFWVNIYRTTKSIISFNDKLKTIPEN